MDGGDGGSDDFFRCELSTHLRMCVMKECKRTITTNYLEWRVLSTFISIILTFASIL